MLLFAWYPNHPSVKRGKRAALLHSVPALRVTPRPTDRNSNPHEASCGSGATLPRHEESYAMTMRDTQRARPPRRHYGNTIIAAIEANPRRAVTMPWLPAKPLPVRLAGQCPDAEPVQRDQHRHRSVDFIRRVADIETPLCGQPTSQWAELDAHKCAKAKKSSLVVFYKNYETEPDARKPRRRWQASGGEGLVGLQRRPSRRIPAWRIPPPPSKSGRAHGYVQMRSSPRPTLDIRLRRLTGLLPAKR